MTNEKLTTLFFDIGFIMAVISMIIGPFGIENWSIATAMTACFLALGIIYLLFQDWEDGTKAVPREERHRSFSIPQKKAEEPQAPNK